MKEGSSDYKQVRKRWFFKEPLTEWFFVEPKMVLLWHRLKKHVYFYSLMYRKKTQLFSLSVNRIHYYCIYTWCKEPLPKAVVLKLFQDEAHLCKVNYFVAPQKKTHDENILLQ